MVKKALAAISLALSTGEHTGLDVGRVGERKGGPGERAMIELTAVFLKSPHGYVAFVEELPGVNSHGRTLAEAREMLGRVALAVFDAERERAEEFISGKECVREPIVLALAPR
jgi:predicted RNase H-like HicB family nuclease